MNIIDSDQRKRALDPTRSFIVQAPAGSGKTELLTKRFLALLKTVEFPEEILAITFTKKSAAEMRDRIITALHKEDLPKSWNLLENPNRLRIQTIDSLNAYLASRMPSLSHVGSAPAIANDPNLLYEEAIENFLTHLEEDLPWTAAIETLLVHLDNDLNKVRSLLIKMLQKRDQWLPHISLNLRDNLEENLNSIVTDALENIQKKYPYVDINQPLLTKELEWRKRLKVDFELTDELKNTLIALITAPNKQYEESEWQILSALLEILKVLVAELRLTFQKYNQIDYIENAQAALLALGSQENPTDLALALDYKIKHILIDEFQDTSNNQFRLLQKLMFGWEPGDGRTLFCVGDPMQSIYRFREAEVGLFIRAQKLGIPPVKLEPLTLSMNFRSTPEVVNWVNDHFKTTFPLSDNIATGAISFSPSLSAKSETNSSVKLHNKTNQAESICELIKTFEPGKSIAILVRSRTHLADIIPALKRHHIDYQAIHIDPLETRSLIQDLIALTKALLHPGHRIAWLSILRAPWCGLTLSDLLILSKNPTTETIWQQLQKAPLSADGQARIKRIIPILETALANRRRLSLSNWVENTWHLLGGPAACDQITDLDDASTFFKRLQDLDSGSDITNLDSIDQAILRLYASSQNGKTAQVQIMTIHNAKGLEFDAVILPHLEARAAYDEKQLLLWLEQTDQKLIMAPLNAVGEESNATYNYIKRQQAIKSDYETSRLLYVAATRAKSELHLFFSAEKKISSNSLLQKIWPSIEHEVSFNNLEAKTSTKPVFTAPLFKRLVSTWENPIKPPESTITIHQNPPGFTLLDETARIIGTVIHQQIEKLCHGKEINYAALKNQLLFLGLPKKSLDTAIETIQQAIKNISNDPKGQWIIHPHLEAKSEFAVTALVNDVPKQFIIDRTFVDEKGIRWIIDYKTSLFIEKEKHSKQLQQYYTVMQQLDPRPIKLGLYFPLIPAFVELED